MNMNTSTNIKNLRKGINHRKHRPYFTNCGSCGNKNYCRKCFKCKSWICNTCQPFIDQLIYEDITVLHRGLCDDCQNELCGR